jgi:hypothetical protein
VDERNHASEAKEIEELKEVEEVKDIKEKRLHTDGTKRCGITLARPTVVGMDWWRKYPVVRGISTKRAVILGRMTLHGVLCNPRAVMLPLTRAGRRMTLPGACLGGRAVIRGRMTLLFKEKFPGAMRGFHHGFD